MKKLLVTTAAIVACVSAFAQGRVAFQNDGNHLLIVDPSVAAGSTWHSLAGLAVPQMGSANPQNMSLLTAELWAGTSAGSLTLQYSSAGFGNAALPDGRTGSHNTILTTAIGATFIQVRFWETSAGSWSAAQQGAGLSGESPVFTVNSGGFLYNPITLAASPANSTWANAPITMSVPEPTSFALAGLGVAALMIFRRRK